MSSVILHVYGIGTSLPSDFPLSINELALLPLIPRLLLLEPFSAPFLISLFRRIMGVSANGRETLMGSRGLSTGCVRGGSGAAVSCGCVEVGSSCFLLLRVSCGWSSLGFLFFLTSNGGGGCSLATRSLPPLFLGLLRRRTGFSVGSGAAALGDSDVRFLVLFTVTGFRGLPSDLSSSIGGICGAGSALAFFARVRVNLKPSLSSS